MSLSEEGQDICRAKYRELYWLKNEYQVIGSDAPDQEALAAAIDECEEKMTIIETILGYTPEA